MATDEPTSGELSTDTADDLLQPLVEAPVLPLDAEIAADLRRQVVSALELRLAEARDRYAKRSKRRAVLSFALAGSLSAAATWGVMTLASQWRSGVSRAAEVIGLAGEVEVVRAGRASPLPSATLLALSGEDELRTGADGLARAVLASGAHVQVKSDARVRFASARRASRAELDESIELAQGRIEVEVPKLPAGASLSVHTRDATVTVHGTRFAVERVGGEAGATRVQVFEGHVWVRGAQGERILGPSDVWSSSGATLRGRNDAAAPGRDELGPGQAPDGTNGPSTLGAQNALLADAMRARASHNPAEALAKLDVFLSRYPDSPLLEAAEVERIYALDQLGARRAELVREASRYLSRHPNGFARDEVKRMLDAVRGDRP